MEAKIETGRHNLKIKMDKELNVLQKEINLHVNDITRIQGLISRLAVMKGDSLDELRRSKEKARKTMKQLKNMKKLGESGAAGNASLSPERTVKATTTVGGTGVINEDNPINMLLFSNMKKTALGGLMSSSLGNTMSSNTNYMNVILPLKHILKNSQLTKFDIATENEQEKKPINAEEDNTKANSGLQTKIKTLLDQRKPPTETLPSLCEMYDDDLNLVKRQE